MTRTRSKFYGRWIVAEFRRRLKAKMVVYLGGCCSKCGYSECIDALESHHTDPTQKEFQISSGDCKRWSQVKLELDKCILLCANCHREVHAELRRPLLEEQRRKAREEVPERKPSVEMICCVCGGKFSVSQSASDERHTCSNTCRAKYREVVEWPSDEKLREMIWSQPVIKVASLLGVSGNAVKHRCSLRGISTPGRGYWASRRAKQ